MLPEPRPRPGSTRNGFPTLRRRLLTALATCLLATAMPALAADYVQASGSTLTFATRYQGEVFSGRFASFRTRLTFDPQQLANARLDVVIALPSAGTANEDRDETLHGPDFFHSSRFPQARFSASAFRHLGGNEYVADGTLSLRGVSRPVALTFTWTPGVRPVLTGRATVRRLDFGIGGGEWADTGLIPDEVAISTKVFVMPVAGPAAP